MRLSRQTHTGSLPTPSMETGNLSETPETCRICPVHNSPSDRLASSPMPVSGPVGDWIESQTNVLGLWLDRLIAEGDPGDLISMVHRQQAWLQMLRAHIGRG